MALSTMAATGTMGPPTFHPAFDYVPVSDVEDISMYRPGGLHPVSINDMMGRGQYRVIHKLNFGPQSTVWLAADIKWGRLVALKVYAAGVRMDVPFTEILRKLLRPTRDEARHPGRNKIAVLDFFDFHGPNGHHRCVVTAPAAMNIDDAKDTSRWGLIPADVARLAMAQLALALDYLHSVGIVHADVRTGNVYFRLPDDVADMSQVAFYERFGEPVLEPLVRADGWLLRPNAPSHVVVPVWLGKPAERLGRTDSIMLLGDFGQSFTPPDGPLDAERWYAKVPQTLRPPEGRFREAAPPSYPVDIWGLACVFWELLARAQLFSPRIGDELVLAEQVRLLGRLPDRWWCNWRQRHVFFQDADVRTGGFPIPVDSFYKALGPPWAPRLRLEMELPRRAFGMGELHPEESGHLQGMLQDMLTHEPERRATITRVLRCSWMTLWGGNGNGVQDPDPMNVD